MGSCGVEWIIVFAFWGRGSIFGALKTFPATTNNTLLLLTIPKWRNGGWGSNSFEETIIYNAVHFIEAREFEEQDMQVDVWSILLSHYPINDQLIDAMMIDLIIIKCLFIASNWLRTTAPAGSYKMYLYPALTGLTFNEIFVEQLRVVQFVIYRQYCCDMGLTISLFWCILFKIKILLEAKSAGRRTETEG